MARVSLDKLKQLNRSKLIDLIIEQQGELNDLREKAQEKETQTVSINIIKSVEGKVIVQNKTYTSPEWAYIVAQVSIGGASIDNVARALKLHEGR